MHSGLQFGGLPINVGTQEHDGELPISRHSAFGPHGDGIQGFLMSGTESSKNTHSINVFLIKYL